MDAKTPARRPKVRQVRSRFMTPCASSSSSAGDHKIHQRSISAQRHRRQLNMSEGDETAARSLDSPFTLSQTGKVSKQRQSNILKENSHRLFDTPTPFIVPTRFSQQRLINLPAASSEIGQMSRTQTKVFNSFVPLPFNRNLNRRESNAFSRSVGFSVQPKKKDAEGLEEVHSLKLLHNRYLQWRFANVNAQVKTRAQQAHTEILELRESVQRKRMELRCLSRIKALLSITNSQTPRLEQWSAIEEEYSSSLSQIIQALSNASLRLPLYADILVDNKELAEALVVASKVMDNITQNLGSYMSKAQEMETLVSELTRVSKRERSLIEHCGIALLKTQDSNIEECSVRSKLLQQQKKSHVNEHNSFSLGSD